MIDKNPLFLSITKLFYLLVSWSGYEERFLAAGCVVNSPECFIFVVPRSHHRSPHLGLEVVFEAGDVPVLEVVTGEVALQGGLD